MLEPALELGAPLGLGEWLRAEPNVATQAMGQGPQVSGIAKVPPAGSIETLWV